MQLNSRMFAKLLLTAAMALPAQASLAATFTGQDDAAFPDPTPNASAAFADFTATLSSWGTDDAEATAETFDPGLSFPGTGVTATTSGVLGQIAPGFTSSGITALLETDAAMISPALNTVFNLSAPVTAFGLFLMQGGDAGNDNPVTFVFENTVSLTSKPVVVQLGPGWATQNTLFFGYTDTDPFNKVTLIETGDLQDGTLYDDITVGTLVPEPSSLVMMGLAAVLVPFALRSRHIARRASR